MIQCIRIFPIAYCLAYGQVDIAVGDEGSLVGMVEVRFARPNGPDHFIFMVELVEPGSMVMVQNLFIKIGKKFSIRIRIIGLAGHPVEDGSGVDGFCKDPMHPVRDDGTSLPIGRIDKSGSAISKPGIFFGPPEELLAGL